VDDPRRAGPYSAFHDYVHWSTWGAGWRALAGVLAALALGLGGAGPVGAQGPPFAPPLGPASGPVGGPWATSPAPTGGSALVTSNATPGGGGVLATSSATAGGALGTSSATAGANTNAGPGGSAGLSGNAGPGGSAGLSGSAAADVARLAEAVNAIRAQNGRPPLHVQAQLTLAAQRHADGMAQSRTMSHVGAFGSRPSDRMGAAGYETCGGGEDVSFGALQGPDDIARGWYDSPGHRAILLDENVREMGLGRGQTADGLAYWALEVGQRPTVAPIVINGEAAASPVSDVIVYVYPQVNDSCLGPASRIAQVTLSNTPDFVYAQTFDYAPSLAWTLAPGEGRRTVYARLTDSSGRTVEAQDDILVSATAPPPSTASDLTPAVQTVNVAGPGGTTQPMTVYRTTFIAPPNAAVTTTPCPGMLTGCLSMSSAGGATGGANGPAALPASLPPQPGAGPTGFSPGTVPGAAPSTPALSPTAAGAAPTGGAPALSGNCPLTRLC
jgi:uncharacterized protein YkwD